MKLSNDPGFTPAILSTLPKNVCLLGSAKDGIFLVLQNIHFTGDSYYSIKPMDLKAGSLIISTEGGHYYQFNAQGGLAGLGKKSSSERDQKLSAMLVQRISIDIVMREYKKEVVKKKASKKKVAKKKAKKKATRKR